MALCSHGLYTYDLYRYGLDTAPTPRTPNHAPRGLLSARRANVAGSVAEAFVTAPAGHKPATC